MSLTGSEKNLLEHLDADDVEYVNLKIVEHGAPDFIRVHKSAIRAGLVQFVESKAGTDFVKRHQYEYHEKLRSLGFVVKVLRPGTTGFYEDTAVPKPPFREILRRAQAGEPEYISLLNTMTVGHADGVSEDEAGRLPTVSVANVDSASYAQPTDEERVRKEARRLSLERYKKERARVRAYLG